MKETFLFKKRQALPKKNKIYIAGKLGTGSERKFLEKLAELAENLGFSTFLPHRDVGLVETMEDTKKIFHGDIIEGFKEIDVVIADLNGLHVGAGTAWELGYAYAKGIPTIGIKTDEPVKDALDSLSAILIESMKIVTSLEDLKKELKAME